MSKKSGLGKFIAGAAIGAGLGLLFAPDSGEKTRKVLKRKRKYLFNIKIFGVCQKIKTQYGTNKRKKS